MSSENVAHGAEVEEVLSFWFGDVDAAGFAPGDAVARWWRKDPEFDAEVRARFGELVGSVAGGRREHWLKTARGCLAFVIVLDQFSRNMFRGTPGMFATDARALAAAQGAVELGLDRAVGGDLRAFFYLPFMHSEDVKQQEHCVALFRAFHDELEGEGKARIANNLKFAIAHRDIVLKWGRFPHRNAILGRYSTPEEAAFLQQPGSAF